MGSESRVRRKLYLIALALIAVVLGGQGVSAALEGDLKQVEGRVQWIAGGKMVVAPVNGGVSVPVDLSRVPVGQYVGVMPGSWVRVSGVPSLDVHRLIATSVTPMESADEQVTLLPRSSP